LWRSPRLKKIKIKRKGLKKSKDTGIKKKYDSEKSILECLENYWKLAEEHHMYKIERFDSLFSIDEKTLLAMKIKRKIQLIFSRFTWIYWGFNYKKHWFLKSIKSLIERNWGLEVELQFLGVNLVI
jgi:hypothetical protein